MAKQTVWVEIDPETDMPMRVLKKGEIWVTPVSAELRQMNKSEAVGSIREQVFYRAKRGNIIMCEFCGNTITETTGHMHEVIPKGQGGMVSLDNCVAICADCHIGKDGEHGDRFWGGRSAGRS